MRLEDGTILSSKSNIFEINLRKPVQPNLESLHLPWSYKNNCGMISSYLLG